MIFGMFKTKEDILLIALNKARAALQESHAQFDYAEAMCFYNTKRVARVQEQIDEYLKINTPNVASNNVFVNTDNTNSLIPSKV